MQTPHFPAFLEQVRPFVEAIEEFVRRKVGVGLTPLVATWTPGPGVVKLPAAHLFPHDELFLLRRRGKPRPQAQILEDLLLEQTDTAPA